MLELAAQLIEDGRRVVVIGAGLIGTETAATLAARHSVTLVDMLDRPLGRFQPPTSRRRRRPRRARRPVRRRRADHRGGRQRRRAYRAHSTHGDLACDVVVSAAGFRTSLPATLAPDGRALTIDVDGALRVPGLTDVSRAATYHFPHPRYGAIAIPHWDNALHSGRQAADGVLGTGEPYARDPYYFSDIGPLRIQQVGLAADAVEWADEDDLIIGRHGGGSPPSCSSTPRPVCARPASCAAATRP